MDDDEYRTPDCSHNLHEDTALNSSILNYYKKFGKKRNLEQYFSLSTAQSDIRDPSSVFWNKLKMRNGSSSDSGEKGSESSRELCRISIKCSVPEQSTSQDESKTKDESVSPPIITEDAAQGASRQSDDDFVKSDENNSNKFVDASLDTSMNKPPSPTSSVTSQRKLEWDSLADVGYGNESDRKTSGSSLSTLERLALKQQYTINDSKQESGLIGPPTAHSTLVEIHKEPKAKEKSRKKFTEIHQRNKDVVEVNIPHSSKVTPPQAINVNLTKHISFNVERDGGITIDTTKQNFNVISSPDKIEAGTEVTPTVRSDKEIQTSLTKSRNSDQSKHKKYTETRKLSSNGGPVYSLHSLRRRNRIRNKRNVRRSTRKKSLQSRPTFAHEKSGEQVSEAESFEYMPGHIYNQNKITQQKQQKARNSAGNKSSLESSGAITNESSKSSTLSFSKDLEKSIELLQKKLKEKNYDSDLKKNLIKDLVKKILTSKYKDEDNTTELLSGSLSSKRLGLGQGDYKSSTTTSTSDGNNSNQKIVRPKKSILRMDKFNANAIASTSQSAPNLPVVSSCEIPISSKFTKPLPHSFISNSDTDMSSKDKESSENGVTPPKVPSEQIYKKYIEALTKEKIYKQHLLQKEKFLKEKLVGSDNAIRQQVRVETKNNRLKELMKDLTRNNYNDGSGDASKLEGGSIVTIQDSRSGEFRTQRRHSVFTLSSGTSGRNCCDSNDSRKPNLRKNLQHEIQTCGKASTSKDHYCCCSHHGTRVGVTDSSIQVNIQSSDTCVKPKEKVKIVRECIPSGFSKIVSDDATGDVQYVCLCTGKDASRDKPENLLIYKCSRLADNEDRQETKPANNSDCTSAQCSEKGSPRMVVKIQEECPKPSTYKVRSEDVKCTKDRHYDRCENVCQISQSSQTNMALCFSASRQYRGCVSQSSKSSERRSCNNSPRKESPRAEYKSSSCGTSKQSKLTYKNVLHETTRWMQTEISINPQISDPSLSDINIVNECHCGQIVSQNSRELKPKCPKQKECVSQRPSMDDDPNLRRFNSDNISCNKNICVNKKQDFACQSNIDLTDQRNVDNNYAIPIKGTNMTLVVNIGASATQPSKNPCNVVNEETITENIDSSEKATCLRNECSKGCQVEAHKTVEIPCPAERKRTPSPRKECDPRDSEKYFSEKNQPQKVIQCGKKFNTYPCADKKSILRSNTDNALFEKQYIECGTGTQNEKVFTDKEVLFKSCPGKSTELSCDRQIRCFPQSGSSIPSDNDQSDKELKLLHSKKIICTDVDPCNFKKSSDSEKNTDSSKDPALDMIKDITRRYSKDLEKGKRKKCFKEIMNVLNYLLDTDDGGESEKVRAKLSQCDCTSSPETESDVKIQPEIIKTPATAPSAASATVQTTPKKCVDKGIQPCVQKKSRSKLTCKTDSSDLPCSSDKPSTSSDSATCRILSKIKRECEKLQQRRCKSPCGKKCEASSSSSNNCEPCKPRHDHCSCRAHKCTHHKKSCQKEKKKTLAYNLILQTSDSFVSEDLNTCNKRQLKNIVIKVPSKKYITSEKVPFQEIFTKIENMQCGRQSPGFSCRNQRSKSLPNECDGSSLDECGRRSPTLTVRDYLERNRPDFIEKTSTRQNCLKLISESRANDRTAKRELLSMLQLERQAVLSDISASDVTQLAKELGLNLRRRKEAPKFISEREMKRHSEKIYKSLPEVVQKKEDLKKERVKKTNLLMASIFKKNLQKKTLRGSVNLSNYSTVIKI